MYRAVFMLFVILWIGCDKDKNTMDDNNGTGDLLRVEAFLTIEQADFTKTNGQITQDLKDLLILQFDTRDGNMMFDANTGEVTTAVDYTGTLGTIHTGYINATISEAGDQHVVDFDAQRMEVAGSVVTTYGMEVSNVAETRNEVINDVTSTREISFELSDMDVCTFLKSGSTLKANYKSVYPPFTDELVDYDCSANASLIITFVYREN